MSIGRDTRQPELTIRQAPVLGGREPQLLTESRPELEASAAARAAAYVPEWTDRRPDDAGVAILKVHSMLTGTAHRRLNRLPRRLALDYLTTAGVSPLAATPAQALGVIEVAEDADGPVEVPEGSVFSTAAGPSGPLLETASDCSALPGRIAALAVLADGWLSLDQLEPPYDVAPFGPRPHPPAELWLGLDTPLTPAGTLALAVELLPVPGRPVAESTAAHRLDSPPLRWEAMTATGAVELAVEFDGTRGLAHAGVIAFRAPDLNWPPMMRPGQTTGTPLRWLRARLLTSSYPAGLRLQQIRLNGVTASAARSVRDEIVEPIDRPATGGSRYRLAQVPVVPGSVVLEIGGSGTELGAAELTGTWNEVPSLTAAQPDDQVFVLDAATGLLSFGDGLTGRAVPEGYRNVLARLYRTGGGTTELPRPEDVLPSELSVPDLTGLRVATITTGSPAEAPRGLLLRGPAVIRSRRRAVAAADYATAALATPGVDIARAHCLPGADPTAPGREPGTVGVVVVPRAAAGQAAPRPDTDTLQLVADHLAGQAGVAGARVVAIAPHYREVAVQGLLVGAQGADLSRLVSNARDRIDDWLDPLVGGDGSGWQFGGPVRWNALVRMLLDSVPRLEAVSQVLFRLDGRRLAPCADAILAPGQLVRSGTHQLEAAPIDGGA